ncbi:MULTISPECIES: hypothetical protein [unclassified Exiguobacterium]|nr:MULTISPECIES: hypothetical protein [unclassified Exiguobacterium]
MTLFRFIVHTRDNQEKTFESRGFDEKDAYLYLEQQLKKSGIAFDDIQPL